MKKKISIFYVVMFFVLLFGIGLKEGRATVELWGDKLTVDGFLRYELAMHVGAKNTNNPDQMNYDLNLSRAFFQTEWNFKPNKMIRIFSKVRIINDSTVEFDEHLDPYDAFPKTANSALEIESNDENHFDIWELYGDIKLGKLWLRLGRQQIVWGEMIGARVLDVVNPLDNTWHHKFEPEEFDRTRIPLWMIRAYYTIEQNAVPWLKDLHIETFINPGDISPNVGANVGAPFNVKSPFPDFFMLDDKDRRGDTEYGFRVGGKIGRFYATLNYIHVYSDNGMYDFIEDIQLYEPGGSEPVGREKHVDVRYPLTEIYGLSLNYDFGSTVFTFEGKYIPNNPSWDPEGQYLEMGDDIGTWDYAFRIDHYRRVFSDHMRYMQIQFQFMQQIYEGNLHDVAGPAKAKLDRTRESFMLKFKQPFFKSDKITAVCAFFVHRKGAQRYQPQIFYKPTDRFKFDIFATFIEGTEDRGGWWSYMQWMDEVGFRVTYTF